MADIADFRLRFPEFANETAFPDARIQLFLDDAALEVSEAKFGACFEKAHTNLAAHFLTIGDKQSKGKSSFTGQVTSNTAEGVSQSYGPAGTISDNMSTASLSTTSYGMEFMRLRKKLNPGPFIHAGTA